MKIVRILRSQIFRQIELNRHMEVIIDFFGLTAEEKRIQSKLNIYLKSLALDTMQSETASVQKCINDYYAAIAERSDYAVVYENAEDAAALIKIGGFHIELDEDSLADRLIDYMTVCNELCSISCFALINLKGFLSDEELIQLYKIARYKKFRLLLLESTQRPQIVEHEKTVVIDEDMCELTLEN